MHDLRLLNKESGLVIEQLLDQAKSDRFIMFRKIIYSLPHFIFKQKDETEIKNYVMHKVCVPVCTETGNFLHMITRILKPEKVVEFGTSFGVSTIFLASALEKNNKGLLITSEIDEYKVQLAKQHFLKAKIAHRIEIRNGDALQTLSNIENIEFLFLDGWKELYLPLFKILEPKLSENAIIIADDIIKLSKQTIDFCKYIQSKPDKYSSTILEIGDGLLFCTKQK